MIDLQMKEDHILLNGSRTVMGSHETIIQWEHTRNMDFQAGLLEIIDDTKPIVIAVQETFLVNDGGIMLESHC